MSDARLLGTPVPFTVGQKTYQVCPLDLDGECLYQVWLEREAYLAIARHRQTLGEDAFLRNEAGWRHELASGTYCWGSDAFWKRLDSLSGQKYLAYLSMKLGEQKGGTFVDQSTLDQISRDGDSWRQLRDLVLDINFPKPKNSPGA